MRTIKARILVAVSGTAYSAAGSSGSDSTHQAKRERSIEELTSIVKEGVCDVIGSDPNVTVLHWVEVELPVPESLVIAGKVVS